jgi:membrane protein
MNMPAAAKKPHPSLLKRTILLGGVLYQQYYRDRLPTQAAALTYNTLFALLPIFVISLLIVTVISAGNPHDSLVSSLKSALFAQLNADKFQITDPSGKQVGLETFADQIIGNAQRAIAKNAGGAGIVAFLVLLYGALSIMTTIEDAFNRIYGSAKARSWGRRIVLYWCVLTLGPIGVAISLTLGRLAYSAATDVHIGKLLPMVNAVSDLVISWLLVFFLYRVIPDTRVQWRAAALGALVAAIIWEIGKWGFGIYVASSAKNSWYGSLAILPLFMLWIYITWTVILLGLEIAYIRQFWPLLKSRYLFLHGEVSGCKEELSDFRWLLAIGVLLERRFREGKTLRTEDAAETLMIPTAIARELLESLQRAHLVHMTSHRHYALARPPEKITAQEILAAARNLIRLPPALTGTPAAEATHPAYPQSAALQELEKVESDWAQSKTLADLAR